MNDNKHAPPARTAPPPKGGAYARQAAMLCQDPAFQLYLDRRRRFKHQLTVEQLADGTHNAEDARDWLVRACKITSRAELDSNPVACQTFRMIRNRFNHWRARQGRQPQ